MEKWIKNKFKNFYKNHNVFVRDVEKREFGMGNLKKKIFKRHLAFVDNVDLKLFLEHEGPFYISHSTAYYKNPSATPMEAKGWKGADIVFDLDAERADRKSINKTKKDLINLIDLVNDYLGAKDILIAFSGNRGFHLHIRDKRFRTLSSNERKKLILFLKGERFNHKKLFDIYNKYKLNEDTLLGPKPTNKGFGGLFAKKVIDELMLNPQKIHRYFQNEVNKKRFIKGIEDGNWGRYDRKRIRNLLDRLGYILNKIQIFSLSIDSGVTQDTTKLIRVPGSLHGSTGFWVMPLKKDEIEEFDPFYDPIVFSSDKVKIKLIKSVKIDIKEFKTTLKKDEIVKVPEYVAIYLILKGYSFLLKS